MLFPILPYVSFTNINTVLCVVAITPLPSWPFALLPQAYTIPDECKNSEWDPPAATCIIPVICVPTIPVVSLTGTNN